MEDSLLLKTPIVRNGREATVGFEPEVWKGWK
jgi:arsenate reductase-like glutaredoxin family protein